MNVGSARTKWVSIHAGLSYLKADNTHEIGKSNANATWMARFLRYCPRISSSQQAIQLPKSQRLHTYRDPLSKGRTLTYPLRKDPAGNQAQRSTLDLHRSRTANCPLAGCRPPRMIALFQPGPWQSARRWNKFDTDALS